MSDALLRPAGSAEAGSGRTRVRCEAFARGEDVVVVVGGEGAHLGAVSLAELRSGDGTARSGTVGALAHREPDLIGEMARSLAKATGRRVVVTGGIHIDAAAPGEIEDILANARAASRELARKLSPSNPQRRPLQGGSA